MKNAKERMDVIAAYRDVGTYRGAAEICGTTHKTVKRIIAAHELASEGGRRPERVSRARNYDEFADLVAESVVKTAGKINAKRLLPTVRAAGYAGRIGTSRVWSRPRSGNGDLVRRLPVAHVRRCGHRARCWPSTGARR